MYRDALLSSCGRYRFWLTRRWEDGPAACFICLNPSTADAHDDDATIRKCIAFAKRWGYSAAKVVNVYALRATDPKELWRHADRVEPENYPGLNALHCRGINQRDGDKLIAAWGNHAEVERVNMTLAALDGPVFCLGKNLNGSPKHPLYLSLATPLVSFNDEAARVSSVGAA